MVTPGILGCDGTPGIDGNFGALNGALGIGIANAGIGCAGILHLVMG
jgi:hypothetical protein